MKTGQVCEEQNSSSGNAEGGCKRWLGRKSVDVTDALFMEYEHVFSMVWNEGFRLLGACGWISQRPWVVMQHDQV